MVTVGSIEYREMAMKRRPAHKRCEKCDAAHSSHSRDNRVRGYIVPKGEIWGDAQQGETCWLCDNCADEAGLRE